MELRQIIESRRSMRRFDESHEFDYESVQRSLELAVLSPNSSNLQLWEFHRVISPAVKSELSKICMGQGAARTASELVVFVTRLDKWKERANWNAEKIRSNIENPEHPSKIESRGLAYYQKIIPLFYDNFPWPLKTLLRKTIILWRTIAGQPMMHMSTKADQRVVAHKSTALAAQTFMIAMQAEGYATCPMEGFDERMAKKLLKLNSNSEITMIVACGIGTTEGISNPRWRVPITDLVTTH